MWFAVHDYVVTNTSKNIAKKRMMSLTLPRVERLLITTALMGAAICLAHPARAAFDPNAGATASAPATSISTQRLPDTRILSDDMPTRPLYSAGRAATPPGTVNPSYASPLPPIQMPRPLYPARTETAAAEPVAVPVQVRPITPIQTQAPVAVAPMPNLPPVDAETQARAEAIMQAEQPAAPAPAPMETAAASSGFIAPAPLIAPAPASPAVVAQPMIVPEPVGSIAPANLPAPQPMAVAATQPVDDISPVVQPDLSSQSREALSQIPSRIDSPKVEKSQMVKLDRVSPQIQDVLGKEAQEENYESVGLSIKVRRPGLDTNYELNQAYQSLMGGDTERAIRIYKDILSVEPRNEDALFGLAATYHRLGNEQQARPFYTALLKVNPNHREALNNFLVLVSSESPQDALPELERLEIRNPDFSPIPAQIAIVYDKLGYPEQAREKMIRAIQLAPENLTYKYNLAIMLDRQKQYADAVALYRLLIQASLNGEQVPASVDSMQKRLNYITTAAMEGRLGS